MSAPVRHVTMKLTPAMLEAVAALLVDASFDSDQPRSGMLVRARCLFCRTAAFTGKRKAPRRRKAAISW